MDVRFSRAAGRPAQIKFAAVDSRWRAIPHRVVVQVAVRYLVGGFDVYAQPFRVIGDDWRGRPGYRSNYAERYVRTVERCDSEWFNCFLVSPHVPNTVW